MKPFAVIEFPEKSLHEYWLREPNGRIGGREFVGWFSEQKGAISIENVTTVFFDREEDADSYIVYILSCNPEKTYVKANISEVAKTTIGPIQRARVVPGGVLPF